MIKKILLTISILLNFGILAKDFEDFKRAMVTIHAHASVSAHMRPGSWQGTGFVTDKKRGYIVTNSHVAQMGSIGYYNLTFHNGRQVTAKPIYYDQYVDFAILKVDNNKIPDTVSEIQFTSKPQKVGSEVFVVSNSEGQGFSFHRGFVSDLYDVNGTMPQGSYIVNMNIAGGASGSAVINKEEKKAIGVLYGGGKTHMLALKASYVQSVLDKLKNNKKPIRKHIGVITELYSLDNAVKYRGFSEKEMKKYLKDYPDTRNRILSVKSVLQGSTTGLMPGDIIWKIEDKMIGADLMKFDKIMDNCKSDNIKLTFIRNGKKINKEIPLYDLMERQVTRILEFDGALFFEANDLISRYIGIEAGTVTTVIIKPGSSLSSLPNYDDSYRITLKSFNNQKIDSLDDLIRAIKDNKSKFINITYQNFTAHRTKFGDIIVYDHKNLMKDINLDTVDSQARLFTLNQEKNIWEVKTFSK